MSTNVLELQTHTKIGYNAFPAKIPAFFINHKPWEFQLKILQFFLPKKNQLTLHALFFFHKKMEDKTKIYCTGKKWGSLISTVFLWYSLFYFALASKYALFRAFRVNCIVIFICFYPKNSFTFYAFIIDTFLCVCVFFVRFVYRKRGKSTDFFRFFVFFQCKKKMNIHRRKRIRSGIQKRVEDHLGVSVYG